MPIIQLQKEISMHYHGKEFTINLIDYQRDNTTITAKFGIEYKSKPIDFQVDTNFVFDIILEDGVCFKDADPITEQNCFVIKDSLIKDQEVINNSLNLRSYNPCEPSSWQPEKESHSDYIAKVLAFDIHKAYQEFLDVCACEIKTSGVSKLVKKSSMEETPTSSKN
ncbi:hypothetical protein [Cardinium endosymbiont of Culicoides punctatus]|uniref:hypothetical protein n=1 Tax=Cardinium endosymbiont of Culicoides punctatus TaxID=2304601 RepID=UPI001058D580|nr:hypothetical protein [Cardinium endosymbiont of Culicoides punctatus]TDG93073.1 hypothetical protein CCPUN_09550 [Cardinium endosymbiont of Culicoides punctatus]